MSAPQQPPSPGTHQLEAIVKRIVAAQLKIDESVLSPETTWGDLNAESMDMIDIIMSLEEELKTDLDFDGVENVLSLKDLIAFFDKAGVSVTPKAS